MTGGARPADCVTEALPAQSRSAPHPPGGRCVISHPSAMECVAERTPTSKAPSEPSRQNISPVPRFFRTLHSVSLLGGTCRETHVIGCPPQPPLHSGSRGVGGAATGGRARGAYAAEAGRGGAARRARRWAARHTFVTPSVAHGPRRHTFVTLCNLGCDGCPRHPQASGVGSQFPRTLRALHYGRHTDPLT